MKINELIAEQTDLDEGIGSFLGKAAGHAVGGLGAAWRDAKQGYKDAKAVWDPQDPAGTYNNAPAGSTPNAAPAPQQAPAGSTAPAPTAPQGGSAPAPQQAPAPQGGSAPAPQQAPAPADSSAPAPQQAPAPAPANSGAIGSIMQAVDKLDPATKKQLAGELEKSIAAAPADKPTAPAAPNAETPAAPGAPTPADSGQDHGLGKQSDGKFITPGQKFDTETGKPLEAPATEPTASTPPASTAAPTTPPAGGKMTAAQQAALKAKLQGQRQAGKTTATQTGSGFKDYVGGSGERMTGVDASGAPVYQKIQREGVEFRSNFLGMMI